MPNRAGSASSAATGANSRSIPAIDTASVSCSAVAARLSSSSGTTSVAQAASRAASVSTGAYIVDSVGQVEGGDRARMGQLRGQDHREYLQPLYQWQHQIGPAELAVDELLATDALANAIMSTAATTSRNLARRATNPQYRWSISAPSRNFYGSTYLRLAIAATHRAGYSRTCARAACSECGP